MKNLIKNTKQQTKTFNSYQKQTKTYQKLNPYLYRHEIIPIIIQTILSYFFGRGLGFLLLAKQFGKNYPR